MGNASRVIVEVGSFASVDRRGRRVRGDEGRGSLWLVGWSICAVALTRAVLFGIRPFIRNLLSSVIQRRAKMVARPLPQGEASFYRAYLSLGRGRA